MSGSDSETASNPLRNLARLISLQPERFHSQNGDEEVQELAKLAMQHSFDQSIKSESSALPSITSLLHSYLPSSKSSNARSTRASKRKRDDAPPIDPHNLPPHELFQKTPLDNLIVKGMNQSQIWNQLELKGNKIAKLVDSVVINEIGGMEQDQDELEEEEEDEKKKKKSGKGKGKKKSKDQVDDDDEMDLGDIDDEEEEEMQLSSLTDSELKALGLSSQQIQAFRSGSLDGSSNSSDSDSEEEESDGESAGGDGYPGASDLSDEEEAEISFEPLRSEEEQRRRKEEKEMEELMRLRGLRRVRNQLNGDEDQDSEDEEDSEDEDEDEEIEMEMDEEDAELLRLVREEEGKDKGQIKGKDRILWQINLFVEWRWTEILFDLDNQR